MPHKHKRQRTANKNHDFNLDPTQFAQPLPVTKALPHDDTAKALGSGKATQSNKERREPGRKDDTPKAFKRLMQLRDTRKGVYSLDNGDMKAGKKRKRTQPATPLDSAKSVEKTGELAPKILPGERLADFAARVNQALPVAGLARKAQKVDGMKERQTKHEKKLQKLVNGWKEEEAHRQEKAVGERDMALEDEEEEKAIWEDRRVELPKGKKGKRKDEDDPWAELKSRREEPRGLHDVAQAPPRFTHIPKDLFKAKAQVANVPNSAGSLRRREELGETRMSMIASYRQMMAEKRAA